MHCTVLIPAYNTGKFISQAIESVFDQTYTDWDIIIVDDGSTDNTAEVASQYLSGNEVSLCTLKKNKGVAYATKVGLDFARGPVITILDSDDRLYNNSLVTGVPHFAKDPKLGFLWTKFICSTGRKGWSGQLPRGSTLWEALMKRGWWRASHQRFIRKEWYEKSHKMNPKFKTASDYQLCVLMASTKCKTLFVPKVTYWYRSGRRGGITDNGRQIQRADARKVYGWAKKGFK